MSGPTSGLVFVGLANCDRGGGAILADACADLMAIARDLGAGRSGPGAYGDSTISRCTGSGGRDCADSADPIGSWRTAVASVCNATKNRRLDKRPVFLF